MWSLLDRHGYETMWCPGPTRRHDRECSLVRTGHCPLVERADVIVSALDQNDGTCAEVARHLDSAAGHPGSTPVVVVVTPRSAEEVAATLPHCDVVSGPLSSKTVLRSVVGVAPPSEPEVPAAVCSA